METSRALTTATVFFFAAMLQSCVTTTTGGFNVESSDAEAMDDFLQLAVGYYEADDMAGAKRHVENALNIDSRNSNAYGIRALIFQREGDTSLAEADFQRAITLDRNNSRVRNNFGALLFSLEKYQQAYDQFELVAADTSYDGRAVAFENLGRCALKLNQIEEADAAFQRALRLNSNLYLSSLELAEIHYHKADWIVARGLYMQYLTTAEFYNIPHTPKSLWLGIQIERQFQDSEHIHDFTLLLTTLYRESPEYNFYLGSLDGN